MSSFALLRTTPRGIYPLGMTKKETLRAKALRVTERGQGDCDALRVTKKGSFRAEHQRSEESPTFFPEKSCN